MKKFIETLKNIYKIEDLRARILYTLGIILIYRLGSKVVLPGVNPMELAELQAKASQGVLGILDMFQEVPSHPLLYSRWVLCLTFQHQSLFSY
jgi:preprotein translocase subunit SecY